MKIALTIIGVILVLLLFGTMMHGITDARTDERTDAFGAVVTAGGDFDTDVVLVADLYDNNVLNVTSITSSLNTDVPIVDSYVAGTNTLTIKGLTASETRTLTVIYKYDALTGDAATAGTFLGFTPLFVIIAVVVVVIGAIVAGFASRGR